MKTAGRQEQDRFVSATEIASMFFCEQKIALEVRHGETVTKEQEAARRRGIAVHDKVHQQAITKHNQRPGKPGQSDHCFVASHVYGYDDPRTWELRRFRDRVMMRHRAGRAAVRIYYRYSPGLVGWLQGKRRAGAIAKKAVDLIRRSVSPWTGEEDGHQFRHRPR